MQIIQNIREKGAAIVIGVIALSLIGFILMDAKPGSNGGIFGGNNGTTIGEINGEPVEATEFSARVKNTEDQYGGRISGSQIYEVRQNVWDQLVTEKVLVKEFEKLGLTFSPKEMSSIMFSEDAPYALKQAFTDKNTGQYDIEKAQQWWRDQAKKSKGDQRAAIDAQIVEPMKLQALYNKYNSMIAASAYYPSWMKQKENADANNFANISYVSVPYNVISDSTVKVSDEEITEYLNKHKTAYKQDGGRSISYVAFNANPSAADTLKSLESINNLRGAFAADTNAQAFVSRNMSAITYYDGYTLKSKMAMAQKDSIAALPIGGVFGPYLDANNFALAKMIATRQLPDSVKCRHILVGTKDPQTNQPTLADSIAKKRIDSIEMAIKGGADFNQMVLTYSDDAGSKSTKGEYDFTSTQTNLAKEFYDEIFYGPVGDKKVIHTEFGYHYIEVLGQKNFEPAYKVAYIAKPILATDETVNMASAQATKLSGEARDAKSLEAYVTKNKLQKVDVPELTKVNDYRLGALQDARQLIKWAFDAKPGEISEPFSIEDQFVVGVLNRIQPEGIPDARTGRPLVEGIVKNAKKADQITKKLGATPTLESAATAYGVQQGTAGADSSLTMSAQLINGIGNEPKVIGAAFDKALIGKVSEPIAGSNGVYVVKVNTVNTKPAETPEMAAQQESARSKAMVQQLSGWMESLKKTATIKDNRSKTY